MNIFDKFKKIKKKEEGIEDYLQNKKIWVKN